MKARTVAGRGYKSLLCDPGSELRVGTRERRKWAKIINGMSKKKRVVSNFVHTASYGKKYFQKSCCNAQSQTSCYKVSPYIRQCNSWYVSIHVSIRRPAINRISPSVHEAIRLHIDYAMISPRTHESTRLFTHARICYTWYCL